MIWLLLIVDAVMTDVDVITTVDAAMETVFLEMVPAAVFSGLSVCCVCVVTMDVETDVDAAMVMIPVGSSLYCFCSAADAEIMVVAADFSHRAEVSSSAFLLDETVSLWSWFWNQEAFGRLFSFPYSQYLFRKRHFHL